MAGDEGGSRGGAPRRVAYTRPMSKAAKRQPAKSAAASGSGRDHDDDHVVEFTLSKRTAALIDAALKGLTKPQQARVLEAIDRVGEEAGEKVGRWIQRNTVANANELLSLMAPELASRDRWDDLRAILLFLDQFDVPVDRDKLARAIEKQQGAGGNRARGL